MKFFIFLKKAYRTFFCVARFLPYVIEELKDLTGVTRDFIEELKKIWHF
ncbi:hypothetical protein ES703_81893 [subsurface metagenome]